MSNLLEKASIILTPTAYDNGKVLCVKPTDGSGDFDFSRNSAATRVNAQGLVENVQILSSNLVTNGDFSDGSTDWTLDTGWSIGDNKMTGNSASGDSYQDLNLSGGEKTFKITFDCIVNSGQFAVRFINKQWVSASGTYTIYETTTSSRLFVDGRASQLFSGSVTNISVVEITTDTNLPRINYEGGCGSWLFEPQSTNLVFQSNTLTAISGGVVTPNAAISPDGTTNAIKVNFSTGVNSGGTISIGGSSAAASTEYTFSFYAKNFSGDGTFRLRLDTDTQATLVNEDFTATSDWVRYTHTFTTDAAASSFGSSSRFRNDTDNNEVLFFGMQLEQQSYATSYIPTSGSTVTRNQDLCTNGGSLASINSSEGVLYFEGSGLVNGGQHRVVSLSDGTNDNLIYIRVDSTANRFTSFARGSSGSYNIITANGINQTNNNKVALVWDATNFRIWINGTESATATINNLPIAMNTLDFTSPTGSNLFFGNTKCVAVWKEALTDAELTSLTTI
tara:strand:+ start:190 stop:1707 length:1518 start_codon:yes stop_codon:yes gene_type:complete